MFDVENEGEDRRDAVFENAKHFGQGLERVDALPSIPSPGSPRIALSDVIAKLRGDVLHERHGIVELQGCALSEVTLSRALQARPDLRTIEQRMWSARLAKPRTGFAGLEVHCICRFDRLSADEAESCVATGTAYRVATLPQLHHLRTGRVVAAELIVSPSLHVLESVFRLRRDQRFSYTVMLLFRNRLFAHAANQAFALVAGKRFVFRVFGECPSSDHSGASHYLSAALNRFLDLLRC